MHVGLVRVGVRVRLGVGVGVRVRVRVRVRVTSARMNCGGSLLPCRSMPPPAESEMGGGRPPCTPCICTPCAIEGELAPAPEAPQPEAHCTSLERMCGAWCCAYI